MFELLSPESRTRVDDASVVAAIADCAHAEAVAAARRLAAIADW